LHSIRENQSCRRREPRKNKNPSRKNRNPRTKCCLKSRQCWNVRMRKYPKRNEGANRNLPRPCNPTLLTFSLSFFALAYTLMFFHTRKCQVCPNRDKKYKIRLIQQRPLGPHWQQWCVIYVMPNGEVLTLHDSSLCIYCRLFG